MVWKCSDVLGKWYVRVRMQEVLCAGTASNAHAHAPLSTAAVKQEGEHGR